MTIKLSTLHVAHTSCFYFPLTCDCLNLCMHDGEEETRRWSDRQTLIAALYAAAVLLHLILQLGWWYDFLTIVFCKEVTQLSELQYSWKQNKGIWSDCSWYISARLVNANRLNQQFQASLERSAVQAGSCIPACVDISRAGLQYLRSSHFPHSFVSKWI